MLAKRSVKWHPVGVYCAFLTQARRCCKIRYNGLKSARSKQCNPANDITRSYSKTLQIYPFLRKIKTYFYNTSELDVHCPYIVKSSEYGLN